jgi:hypothetical protein
MYRSGARLLPAAAIVATGVVFAARAKADVIGGVPSEARRRVDEKRFAARPFLLQLRLGSGTIVGPLGITASFTPWSFLSFGAGVGGNSEGPQLGAFAAVRPLSFVSHRHGLLQGVGVELGYSTGAYDDRFVVPSSDAAWDRVHWLEPLAFYELRTLGGFDLLAGMGVAVPLGSSGYRCSDEAHCSSSEPSTIVNFSVGVGFAGG